MVTDKALAMAAFRAAMRLQHAVFEILDDNGVLPMSPANLQLTAEQMQADALVLVGFASDLRKLADTQLRRG